MIKEVGIYLRDDTVNRWISMRCYVIISSEIILILKIYFVY